MNRQHASALDDPRNAWLRPKSTVQSATGIRAARVEQKSRGFTAGAFSLRALFHGKTPQTPTRIKRTFLIAAINVPFCPTACGASVRSTGASLVLLCAAFFIWYVRGVAERWFFFAEARHSQDLCYRQAQGARRCLVGHPR
jgi:hypothetical protein